MRILLCLSFLLIGFKALGQEYVPGEVIVKLKGKSYSPGTSQFMGKAQDQMALKSSMPSSNIYHFALKSEAEDVMAVVNQLNQDPDVEYAEPNYILKKIEPEPGDEQVYSQEDVSAMSGNYVQSGSNIQATDAWNIITPLASNSARPIVAIIDTGVSYSHTLFTTTSAIWSNPGEIANNGIDDDGNGYIDDVRGWNFYGKNNNPNDDDSHGTHVAGIVLGAGQDINATDQAKIRIMPLKFLGPDGNGSTSDAIAAIRYAVANGAKVINNSWGGPTYSQALHDALKDAYDQKVVIVAASGNYGANNDLSNLYPANYPVPSLISVAATTDTDKLATFSNYGATLVHLGSPGVSIFSSIPGNTYTYKTGTSMAAPLVAGLAALAMREAPNLTGYQIRSVLLGSATAFSALASKVSSGSRVNSYQTILAAKAQTSTSAYQPSYVAINNSRAPASSGGGGGGKGGCGTVMDISGGGGGGFGSTQGLLVAVMLMLPLVVWSAVRFSAPQRRKFERFVMSSAITVKANGREIVGHLNTISVGGASFEADALLEKGGVVTMQISSPDGKEQVQVEGRVVWSEAQSAYGVQFSEAKDSVVSRIRAWTASLVKA